MITVYTALFGDYVIRDTLRPPPAGCGARYVCFTDGQVTAPGWEIIPVDIGSANPRFLARLCKTRPDRWLGPDVTSLWMDASCQLLTPAVTIAREMVAPITGFQHPKRDTVAKEGALILKQKFAPADDVLAQLAAYEQAGFPLSRPPLTTTGLLLRSPEAQRFNVLWEAQIVRYTLRDQLGVDYCAWATETPVAHWPGSYLNNGQMRYHKHGPVAA